MLDEKDGQMLERWASGMFMVAPLHKLESKRIDTNNVENIIT